MRSLAIGILAVALGGCRSSVAPIEIDVGGDAGTCAQYTDLRCVNYLRFSVKADNEFTTQCVKLKPGEVLESLCDVPKLADGRALFTMGPDEKVVIDVVGMRVYPPDTCESGTECPARRIFFGRTEEFRLGDVAGRSIPLPIAVEQECGPREESFKTTPSRPTCEDVCTNGKPVCTFSDGWCLCNAYE